MKKDLSNTEKWNQRLAYALTILVLIDCIVPFTSNIWRRRTSNRHQHYGLKLVDTLGKIANRKHVWSFNEFNLETSDHEEEAAKNEKWLKEYSCKEGVFHQNLSVFILPDLRRTGTGNENVAAVSSNQELSLEDSDAIDFYWRQDIDAEKGLYPNLWSPDLQHERDVQLVTEKTLLQSGFGDPNVRGLSNQNDVLRGLLAAQKEQFGFDTSATSSSAFGDDKSDIWQQGKVPMVYQPPFVDQQQGNQSGNAFGGRAADANAEFDWLNSTTTDLLNDVFLDDGAGLLMNQGQPSSSEYAILNGQTGDLNTPPVSMDWDSKPPETTVPSAGSHGDPMLFDGLFGTDALDALPTPDLQFAPTDMASLFANHPQLVQDVAEAQTTKEMMLHHTPIVPVDAFPTISATDVMPVIPVAFDENFPATSQQSEVVIETLQPFSEQYPVSNPTWPQMVQPFPPTNQNWNPTYAGSGTTAVSPTWSGDHDYVSPALEVATSASTPFAVSWSTAEDVEALPVKSEPQSWSYEDDEENSEDEDSNERSLRAASERDEIRARQMGLPFTAAQIVTMPQSDYVSLTRSTGRFTREQIELIKEIRRHGGNKEAARRSRQKKVQVSKHLQDEVRDLERERHAAMMEYEKLRAEIEMEQKAIDELKRKNIRK